MINTLFGEKQEQIQKFLSDGTRIPVTVIHVPDSSVVMVKTKKKDGYWSLQLGIGSAKKITKAAEGHIRGAKLNKAPRFFREIRLEDVKDIEGLPKVGDIVKGTDILKPGDIIDVTGISKGKGFAGVVKRHHFKGGPRTHGQSDRERAPGSIGQTTTPGRVYKGKRMAGRMGGKKATVKNLLVVDTQEQKVLVKGLVPGVKNSLIMIKKKGENKKFVPLYKEAKGEKGSLKEEVNKEVE